MNLSGVMIGSEQPKVLGEFYTQLLGTPGYQQDDWYGFGDKASSLMVGGHSEVSGKSKEPQRMMISFTVNDVKAEFSRVKEIDGASIVAEPYQPDSKENPDVWLATLSDPDGNFIQLSTPWEG